MFIRISKGLFGFLFCLMGIFLAVGSIYLQIISNYKPETMTLILSAVAMGIGWIIFISAIKGEEIF